MSQAEPTRTRLPFWCLDPNSCTYCYSNMHVGRVLFNQSGHLHPENTKLAATCATGLRNTLSAQQLRRPIPTKITSVWSHSIGISSGYHHVQIVGTCARECRPCCVWKHCWGASFGASRVPEIMFCGEMQVLTPSFPSITAPAVSYFSGYNGLHLWRLRVMIHHKKCIWAWATP